MKQEDLIEDYKKILLTSNKLIEEEICIIDNFLEHYKKLDKSYEDCQNIEFVALPQIVNDIWLIARSSITPLLLHQGRLKNSLLEKKKKNDKLLELLDSGDMETFISLMYPKTKVEQSSGSFEYDYEMFTSPSDDDNKDDLN
jgi:hypothetical protein